MKMVGINRNSVDIEESCMTADLYATDEPFHVPEVLSGDYFQLVYNAVCLAIGVPLNVSTLIALVQRQRK